MRPARVLLIDDSIAMRKLIRLSLAGDRRLEVVGEASCAEQARERINALRPDVLTLDIEMPGMSGLRFLDQLMRVRPMPVVMISSMTRSGSEAAVAALSLGAVDCVGKPEGRSDGVSFPDLADRLVVASGANLVARKEAGWRKSAPLVQGQPSRGALRGRALLIGASTGGVDALERLLSGFPANCPPTVIVQHMPESFLASFAARLDASSAPRVTRAVDGMTLQRGCVILAPGGDSHLCLQPGRDILCRLRHGEKRNGHRPSADVLFHSALSLAPGLVVALLTGMGRDGAEGMLALRRHGARTLAQDERSSVIWGMPRAAWENGGAEALVGIDAMAETMLDLATDAPLPRGVA